MKKAMALALAAILLLLFFGCDTGTSPGSADDPSTPGTVRDSLSLGTLTLTLNNPDVSTYFGDEDTPYDDGEAAYAVITGASSNGATFRDEISFDTDSVTLSIEDLLPGTWNIKVKVWDDLTEGDDMTDVVALGYETAVITGDADTSLIADLYTMFDVQQLLNVFLTGKGVTEEAAQNAAAWGIYSIMAYEEELAQEFLATGTNDDLDELETILGYLDDMTALSSYLDLILGEVDAESGMTYREILNSSLGVNYDTAGYISFFQEMGAIVSAGMISDYEFLYFDLFDLTLTGLADEDVIDPAATVEVALSASCDYETFLQGEYVWYLNGTYVGTGSTYTLSLDDCYKGSNLLSLQYQVYGVGVSSENIIYTNDTLVSNIIFADSYIGERVISYGSSRGWDYVSEYVSLSISGQSGTKNSIVGLEAFTSLDTLTLSRIGLEDENDINPLLSLNNLSVLNIRYDTLTESAENLLRSTLKDCTIDIRN